jgi:Uma2 family endonuclease
MVVEVRDGLTRADLDDLPDDGRRYELLDGRLFVTPLARRRHQWVVTQISYRLKQWAEQHGGTVYAGVNVDLAEDTHLEPDVVFSYDEDLSGEGFVDAPELVIEISSPSTRTFDLGEKKDRYAAEGCREFWFVDLDRERILTFRRRGERFDDPGVHERGDVVTTPLLEGLELDVDDALGPAGI